MISLILVACGNETTGTETNETKEETEELEGNEEKDPSAPLIDENNAINDREIIRETVERTREELKLGFITDDYPISNIQNVFYPETEKISYGVMYGLPTDTIGSFQYNIDYEYEEDLFQTLVDELDNPKQLDHDSMDTVYYGEYDDEVEPNFLLFGEKGDKLYNLYAGYESEGYSFDLIEAMGHSMKTEEEGAYDPFYKHFSMDLDEIKFPHINNERAEVHSASVSYWDTSDNSRISLSYNIEDGTIYYGVELEPTMITGDGIGEGTTDDGVAVTEYEDYNDDRYFGWDDGIYYYYIQYALPDENELTTEEIYEVIDSAMADERTFEDTSFIEPITDTPQLTENEEKINEQMKEIKTRE